MVFHQPAHFHLALKPLLRLQNRRCENLGIRIPLLDSTVVRPSALVIDDEWVDAVTQALLHHEDTPYTPVVIVEGVNPLEVHMKSQNLLQLGILALVILDESAKLLSDFQWRSKRESSESGIRAELSNTDLMLLVRIGAICQQVMNPLTERK